MRRTGQRSCSNQREALYAFSSMKFFCAGSKKPGALLLKSIPGESVQKLGASYGVL